MSPFRFVLNLFQKIRKEHCKGKANEFCVVAAFQGPFYDIPPWFQDIENASEVQDAKGIDVMVRTDAGPFKIQVKSCEEKAAKFRSEQEERSRGKDILVIVILEHYTPEEVRQVVLSALEPAYHRTLDELACLQGATFIPSPVALPQT